MEFLEEESRPKLLFQSHRSVPTTPISTSFSLHKPTLFISLPLSLLFFFLSLFYFQSEPLQSIFFWLASSLLLGPFAPSSVTAGDIAVGRGPPLPPQNPQLETPNSNSWNLDRKVKRLKPKSETSYDFVGVSDNERKIEKVKEKEKEPILSVEESEWTSGDLDVLKKQMVKNPVGMPGRWEVISEVFDGRHKAESVMKKAKSLGDKRVSFSDSFDKFLKNRKPVDKRVEDEIENVGSGGAGIVSEKECGWGSGEDIALLNALKAFPKDVAMRWEKITAAVPGRSKAECMKRVAELKKTFRSSKAPSSEK